MRLKSHVLNKAVAARSLHSQWHHLRPLFTTQLLRSSQCRHQSTSPERIAILGGGIAGLSSAYFVSKTFPKAQITLFEKGKETGGWIQSRRVEVEGEDGKKGEVLFELGPRTLRNSTVTAGLVCGISVGV
jgi:oxygen-dependent protoporphyrinogen oxidase